MTGHNGIHYESEGADTAMRRFLLLWEERSHQIIEDQCQTRIVR